MRALITGGAGFLGANIAEHLLSAGWSVTVLDNYATSQRVSLAPHPSLQEIEGSVADPECVAGVFETGPFTHVIHSAAAYKDPDDWQEDVRSNVLGTVNVVQACLRSGVERLLHFQTALAYGRTSAVPIPSDHPLHPLSSYSISKAAGERYIAVSGLPFVSLRLANVYGPRTATGPLAAFYERLKAGKPCQIARTRRDFVYITDFLRLLDRMLPTTAPTGFFNVSSGQDVSIAEIYAQLVACMGVTPATTPDVVEPLGDDLGSLLLDPATVKETFGWEPEVPLAEGIAKLVAHFDAHGLARSYSHLRRREDRPRG